MSDPFIIYDQFGKVRIFWEGHKILLNLHLNFVLCSASQKYGEDFVRFCGLLSTYELYLWLLISTWFLRKDISFCWQEACCYQTNIHKYYTSSVRLYSFLLLFVWQSNMQIAWGYAVTVNLTTKNISMLGKAISWNYIIMETNLEER